MGVLLFSVCACVSVCGLSQLTGSYCSLLAAFPPVKLSGCVKQLCHGPSRGNSHTHIHTHNYPTTPPQMQECKYAHSHAGSIHTNSNKTALWAVWSLEPFPIVAWDVNSLLYKVRERGLLPAVQAEWLHLPSTLSRNEKDRHWTGRRHPLLIFVIPLLPVFMFRFIGTKPNLFG